MPVRENGESTPAETHPLWMRPVKTLPGVAARRAAQLDRLSVATWFDLLCWFPRDYEDWSTCLKLAELSDGQDQTFVAEVSRKPGLNRRGRLTVLRTVLRDGQQAIAAVWFNQPWLADKLATGRRYRFHGRVQRDGRTFQVLNPSFEPYQDDAPAAGPAFRPIYSLTGGLTQGVMRSLVRMVLERLTGTLPEPLPAWLRRDYQLCAVDFAYSRIHQPADAHEVAICRRRIGFEELFLLRTGLWLLRRHRRQAAAAWPLCPDRQAGQAIDLFLKQLPFALTAAQKRSWQEIKADLEADRPMSRLLQGDVGSGKTVVAALAMLQCALCGAQAVLMAPTAVLARQHYLTLSQLLAGSGCSPALLTGATPAGERKKILSDLVEGRLSIIVGTHALIEDQVCFQKLGLAITDEQHRFGVRQRRRLGGKAADAQKEPHTLVMSATPIPRSLALVLYGDMDLSLIDELPAGRAPIATYTAAGRDRPRIEQLMRRFVQEGRQVYVVCPMIEEQAELDLESAVSTYNHLAQDVFPDLAVGLLHGGLRQPVKDAVMDEFMQGKVQVLVSTTVIEVGVDNANAALMVIENAERFGLAQLHQLRGRIGRGRHRSICVLISDADDDLARKRLRAICHSADGFAVAEQDLQLRGPGDFFGTRQHGLPPLRIANLYRDRDLMQEVEEALQTIIRTDPDLLDPEHSRMRRIIIDRYQSVFADVGL
jgi:ATP-dependent DNA helicase RecG